MFISPILPHKNTSPSSKEGLRVFFNDHEKIKGKKKKAKPGKREFPRAAELSCTSSASPAKSGRETAPARRLLYSSANNGCASPPPPGRSCFPHRSREGPVPQRPPPTQAGKGMWNRSCERGHLRGETGKDGGEEGKEEGGEGPRSRCTASSLALPASSLPSAAAGRRSPPSEVLIAPTGRA